MVSRKSSITNAFVNAVIPVVVPDVTEIEEALRLLEMSPEDVRCAYCGDRFTEWDHLRPLVIQRRPTGYISEIANLVPACGKCNQSKGNKPWRSWMCSKAKWSPTTRGIADLDDRIARLERYERWKTPTKVDFVQLIGSDEWEQYWSLCEGVVSELKRSQEIADALRNRICKALTSSTQR